MPCWVLVTVAPGRNVALTSSNSPGPPSPSAAEVDRQWSGRRRLVAEPTAWRCGSLPPGTLPSTALGAHQPSRSGAQLLVRGEFGLPRRVKRITVCYGLRRSALALASASGRLERGARYATLRRGQLLIDTRKRKHQPSRVADCERGSSKIGQSGGDQVSVRRFGAR